MESATGLDGEEILKRAGAELKPFGNEWMLITKSGTGIVLHHQIKIYALREAMRRMFGDQAA